MECPLLTEITANARGSRQEAGYALQAEECIGERVGALIVDAVEGAIVLAIAPIRGLRITAVRVLAGTLSEIVFLLEQKRQKLK